MKPSADPIVIIGAGAAGLMAAAELSAAGRRTVVLERGDRAARKILISGGGRCNFTHDGDAPALLARFPQRAARFLKPAFYEFPPTELRRWFAFHRMESVVEADGCVFPQTGRAGDVRDALLLPGKCAAEFRTKTAVTAIIAANGRVTGVETSAGRLAASAVILATGGPAWPAVGATSDGFPMLEALGHTVIPPRPGLAPLHADEVWIRNLQGVSLPHVRLSYNPSSGGCATAGLVPPCEGQPTSARKKKLPPVSVEGPILFTHFGFSGPAALDLSLHLAETPAEITISLLPSYTTESLEEQLIGVAAQHGQRRLDLLLKSALPQRAAQAVLAAVGIPEEVWLGQLKKEWRRAAAVALTAMPVRITRVGGWDEAMVTVGGCDLGEIKPQTMESRKVAGLFIVGELLDLAGPTGGYNLHAALATGRLAARSIIVM
jgi:hypothetical protein